MALLLSGTRIYGTANVDSVLSVGLVTSNTSTSNTTGSLIVTGGAGITGNVYSGAVYTNGLFYASNGQPFVTSSAAGATLSGYLANTVITANSTGYLGNTTGLTFVSSNTTLITTNVRANIVFSDSTVLRSANISATMQIGAANNGVYYFTVYTPKPLTITYLSGQVFTQSITGASQCNVTIYYGANLVGNMTNVSANANSSILRYGTGANTSVPIGSTLYANLQSAALTSSDTLVLTLGMQ